MKARKRGRPPKLNADRFPNGKIKPAWSQRETERDVKSVALEARKRIHGLDDVSDLAGYTLGRIYIDKAITRPMLDAGNAYSDDMFRYYSYYMGQAPTVSAQNLMKVRGFDGDVSQGAADRGKKASARFMELETALGTAGFGVKRTVYNVCVDDCEALRSMPPAQFDMLRRGLTALIWFYGIPNIREVK